MKIQMSKLNHSINKLNTLIEFIEENETDKILKNRYTKVLRYQKALIRDIDRQGRKIPVNTPIVCEMSGSEVNSVREKEPPFKLEDNIHLSYNNSKISLLMEDSRFKHNSYTYILNNYSIKSIKKQLERKIRLNDLSSIEDNLLLIMEIFKHESYYKKYFDLSSFKRSLDKITLVISQM
tara:strand:+ start:127 stop:663 length:537 start_codon:yes stop_codon:yes gene_type:complete